MNALTQLLPALARLLCVLLLGVVADRVIAADSDALYGRWLTEDHKGVVELFRCDARICGRLVWFKPETPGELATAVDRNNPDNSQKRRLLCGITMLGDFKSHDANHWDGGWIYSPDNGKTYRATLTLVDANVLKLRGYVGVPLFGETQTWTRATTQSHSCGED